METEEDTEDAAAEDWKATLFYWRGELAYDGNRWGLCLSASVSLSGISVCFFTITTGSQPHHLIVCLLLVTAKC